MAVKEYTIDGVTFWEVYVDVKSKERRSVRFQKRIKSLKSKEEALFAEKKLFKELCAKVKHAESTGITWREVIDRWSQFQIQYPSGKYVKTTIYDYCSLLRNWTSSWLERPASTINRADGRDILLFAKSEGKKHSFIKHLKSSIHIIYNWGIDERLITDVRESPVRGIEILKDREEKQPEILSLEEIRALLKKAKEQGHPWYPIWTMAVHTGCRSGELQEVRKSDFEIISREDAEKQDLLPFNKRRYGFLRIKRAYNARTKQVSCTKAGYWRTVPISKELYWFLWNELNFEKIGTEDPVLPRFSVWQSGYQAEILRGFCKANKLPSVRFHTLRACFATQLISSGIPATVVMKIAGWKDMKTMQRYIRLAGIDEAGATEVLNFIPTENAVMGFAGERIGEKSK